MQIIVLAANNLDSIGLNAIYGCYILLLVPILVPCKAGFTTGFVHALESRLHNAGLKILVDVEIQTATLKGHADIAIIVVDIFEGIAVTRGLGSSSSAIVRLHPIAMLVGMTCAGLDGTPVNLGDNDGVGFHHRDLHLKLAAHGFLVGIVVIV